MIKPFWMLFAATMLKLGSSCDCGYEDLIADSDYCYKFQPDLLSFEDANLTCSLDGGSLIEVNSFDESEIIGKEFHRLKEGYELLIGLKKDGGW